MADANGRHTVNDMTDDRFSSDFYERFWMTVSPRFQAASHTRCEYHPFHSSEFLLPVEKLFDILLAVNKFDLHVELFVQVFGKMLRRVYRPVLTACAAE